jgi:cold shock protein
MQRVKGKVTWFNDAIGSLETDSQKNIFVHYTSISDDGFKTLSEDQDVEFDLDIDNVKGLQAHNVRKV